MRAIDRGGAFVVTRNGVPVAELTPLRQGQFVSAEVARAAFVNAPRVDAARFRADLDAAIDQDPMPVADQRHARGLIDTSVVIDLETIDPVRLPEECGLSAISMAELAAGPHATTDVGERARRQDRLQRAEATFDPLPLDVGVARAYGRVYAAVTAAGGKARGRRAVDLFIAATAVAAGLPLYTRNPGDFEGLSDLLEVVGV